MAARIRGTLATQRTCESLWKSCPPCFLAPSLRHFSTSTPSSATNRNVKFKRQGHLNAHTIREVQRRKEANINRQRVIKEQTRKEYGDPIRGVETDFVRSFDADSGSRLNSDHESLNIDQSDVKANPDEPTSLSTQGSSDVVLDHGLDHSELREALRFSDLFTEPISPTEKNPSKEKIQQARAQHEEWESRSKNASEAVRRIVSLHNGSNMHRTKHNVQRIVAKLGRHITDNTLKPRASAEETDPNSQSTIPRVGPDTGSSEVQIGILTAKIRILADRYGGEAKQDKINKRNLRLLLHRRQKLLKYLERKERGSERWTHMLKTLGLTPATWRGELAVQ